MAHGFRSFLDFEDGKYVHLYDFPHLSDFICGNMQADYIPSYKYWYNMYSYSSKAFIVYHWGESKGLEPIAKWGEAICEDKLVNIFEEHKDCRKGCGSVYYKLKEYDIPPKYSL